MNEYSRRSAIRVFAGGITIAAAGAPPIAGLAQSKVSIPSQEMRLTRVLSRTMRGAAVLTVTRSWDVRFETQQQGITITGRQIAAKVEAPERLAPIAAIEEQRSTDGMWPITLSQEGRILMVGSQSADDDLAAAVEVAQQYIASHNAPAAGLAAQRQYLRDLQRAGSSLLDRMPSDLFFPAGTPHRSKREIDLPGGIKGEFELSYLAQRSPEGDWLKSAVRRIVTRVAQSERHATEEWTLDRA